MPAKGGITVVSPGRNFAKSSARTPWRRKRFSVRRTHTSGSSETWQSRKSTGAPRRRPSSCQTRSTGSATAAIAPITRRMLARPCAARAPTPSRAGTAGRGTPICSATTRIGRISALYRSSSWTVSDTIGPGRAPCSVEEADDGRDDLIRRLLHQPVPGTLHDDPGHVRRHEPGLLDEERARGLLTRQHEKRHRKLARGERREVPGVLLEGLEVLEPGAHALGAGVGLRVHAAIRLRNRLLR